MSNLRPEAPEGAGDVPQRAVATPFDSLTVRAIVAGILVDRAFDRCPVLADALEDTGAGGDCSALRSDDIARVKRSFFDVAKRMVAAVRAAEGMDPLPDPAVAAVLDQFEQYRLMMEEARRRTRREFYRHPPDEADHGADALRYAMQPPMAFATVPMPPADPIPGYTTIGVEGRNSWGGAGDLAFVVDRVWYDREARRLMTTPSSSFLLTAVDGDVPGTPQLPAFRVTAEQMRALQADPLTVHPGVKKAIDDLTRGTDG